LRLVTAGARISGERSSSTYQRIDQLGGGNFSVMPDVSEMMRTTSVGASRSSTEAPAIAPKTPP